MNTALNYQPEVLVDTADLSREEWLDYRRLGIGGSIMQNFVNGMKHILKDKGKSMISITVVGHIISPLER